MIIISKYLKIYISISFIHVGPTVFRVSRAHSLPSLSVRALPDAHTTTHPAPFMASQHSAYQSYFGSKHGNLAIIVTRHVVHLSGSEDTFRVLLFGRSASKVVITNTRNSTKVLINVYVK